MLDSIIQFARAFASSVSGDTKAVLVQVAGIGGLDPDDELDDDKGEIGDDSKIYGALGVVSRPKPPERVSGREVAAEVVCLRTSDGLVPIGWRDLRLDSAFPSGQKEGSTALVGYGKGFITLDLNDDGENILVAYCPFDFVGGVAQKAHSMILDPEQGITITHADGYQFSVTGENGFMLSTPNGATWARFKDTPQGGELMVQSAKIMLQGNVALGANVIGALPLLPGPASPGSPSVFISPV